MDDGHSTYGPEVAVLLEPYGAVYIEVRKVACTSLKVVFAHLLGISIDELAAIRIACGSRARCAFETT